MSRPSLPRKCKGVKGPNLSISKRNPTSPSIKKRKKKTANMAEQRPASQSNDPTSAHAASGTADDGVYATRQALGEALLNAARFRLGAMAGVGEDNNVDGVCWSWDILGRNIRFFAEEFFPKKISWELLSTANQQSLTFWAPKARQYLECGAGSCSKQRPPPPVESKTGQDSDPSSPPKSYSKDGSGVLSSSISSTHLEIDAEQNTGKVLAASRMY